MTTDAEIMQMHEPYRTQFRKDQFLTEERFAMALPTLIAVCDAERVRRTGTQDTRRNTTLAGRCAEGHNERQHTKAMTERATGTLGQARRAAD